MAQMSVKGAPVAIRLLLLLLLLLFWAGVLILNTYIKDAANV